MIEDEVLKLRFKCGSKEALCRIYEKYEDYLLTLAMALLNNIDVAEDVVHDVFVSFAKSVDNFRLKGSLRNYLATCVTNRARDQIRANRRRPAALDDEAAICSNCTTPDRQLSDDELMLQLNNAVALLPYEQREVVILRLRAGMKFREIAKLQAVSVNTVRGRYRYGIDKLRALVNGEVK